MDTYRFHVKGMHCKSCPLLIESELTDLPAVKAVKADLNSHSVEVTGDFGGREAKDVAAELSKPVEKHGYAVVLEWPAHRANWKSFQIALPLALAFIALFVLLQKMGIVNLVTSDDVTYGTAFLIGVVASLSTCMAVVGGLVLSMSANFAKEGEKVKPQMLFHVGRLLSFFLLGGAIGAIGSAFQLGGTGTFVLSLLVAIVLLVLGVNLLDVLPWAKKLQPTLPAFFTRHVQGLKQANHVLTPLLVGVATFFLPCGFTQSMQIYSLTTGSFSQGALTMSAFALGTLPVLSLLSFTSVGIRDEAKRSVFFKTAGIVVIFFAVYNMINSLVAVGALPPVFNF